MTKQKLFRKITSGLLAVLMVLPLFVNWKVEAAAPEDHTVSTNIIENEYLKAWIESGKQYLHTTGGDPAKSSDNNKRLLYNGTSYTYVKIGSSVYTFSATNVKATADGTSLYSYQIENGIKIERFVSFAYNTYTSRYDTVEYKYVLTNTSTDTKSVGTRIMFDTMLGDNDHAPFKVNGREITTGTTYTGADIPQVWSVYDSFTSPTVIGIGKFWNDASDKPDKVQFINWSVANDQRWDCTASGSIGDSAVNVYFNPTDLAPGESRTVRTYYGVSEFIPGPIEPDEPPIPDSPRTTLDAVMAPRELLLGADGESYQGNPFNYSAWVRNTGTGAATNVTATLTLPAGLSTTDPMTVNIGDLAAEAYYGLSWNITAETMPVATTLGYTVTITADGEDPIVANYTINLPAAVHTHTYTETSSTPAGCETPGYTYLACACGETSYYYLPALGHRYQSAVVSAATCTTPGVIRHTCTRCAEYYDTYVYAEHSYSEVEFVAATCTVDGYHKYQCATCTDEYIITIPGDHSYEANIISLPTPTSDGETEYVCSLCGDRYVITTPARAAANILLVQDRLPWTENINAALLDRLVSLGYADGWDMTTTSSIGSVDLANYSVIYIANDQTTATYDRLAAFNAAITSFANAGGVVVYGACDHGWAGGNISYALPGNVTKGNYYSYRNYIANLTHNIVTGELTDKKALTDALLYSTYSSHTYFENLPVDASVILTDANGRPTLVEYPLGNGYIIATGLTWEYTYVRNFVSGTSFAKSVYDDMLVHALTLADPCAHNYGEGVVVDPTCASEGYTLYTCVDCGATMKRDFEDKLPHTPGAWTVIEEPTVDTPGLKAILCTVCETVLESEILPPLNEVYFEVTASSGTVILGQTMEFIVAGNGFDPVKAIALQPWFDEGIFELVSVEWLVSADLQAIEDDGTLRSISVWANSTDVNVDLYKITLRAIALSDISYVGVSAMIQDGDGRSDAAALACRVSVIRCPHATYTYSEADDVYHVAICDVCGHTELLVHEYDDDLDAFCNVCEHRRILVGDLEDDLDVDSDDAIYLLFNTIHGAVSYPLNQPCDFDNDGDVDSDDAIYLLYHTYFGSGDYPLVH